jgi:hypothetical protein
LPPVFISAPLNPTRSFAVLLFVFEASQFHSVAWVDDVYVKNFGFMFKPISKSIFLCFVKPASVEPTRLADDQVAPPPRPDTWRRLRDGGPSDDAEAL